MTTPASGSTSAVRSGGDLLATGHVLLYRLWDLGDEIDLEMANRLFADSAPARRRPARFEARALSIPTPPLVVALGTSRLALGAQSFEVESTVALFDFGVASLRLQLPLSPAARWSDLVALVTSLADQAALEALTH